MNKNALGIGVCALGVALSGGCSSGPSGEYGGPDCGLFDKISFRDNGKVYISMKMFGMQMGETAGDYSVDDEKVVVTANNQTTVFTLNDDGDLEGSMLGDKIICRKGAGGSNDSDNEHSTNETQPGIAGATFGGVACMLDSMTFGNDGKVDMVVGGEHEPGTYSMNGDQLLLNGPGGSVTFTLTNDSLVATIEGQRTICSRM